MRIHQKIKLFLKSPIGAILFMSNLYVNKKRLVFKKNMLFSKYDIDPSVGIRWETFIYGEGKIKIGRDTYFGKNTFVASHPKEFLIKIGDNCRISHGCHFRTEDNDPKTLHLKRPVKKGGNIVIGNNCWIGANCFIRGNIVLGDNVTVGANSVVTKSFPANVVIAGCPARIIKRLPMSDRKI